MKKSFSRFAAIFTLAFMCLSGCSKTTEIPDVGEYFSTDFDVKSFDAANLSVDTYEISEINGDELSELYPLACYNGKLYLTKGAVAESNFTEAETGRIIEYDLKTKTVKTIVESRLPSLPHSSEESENVSENDELIFVDYWDMGFYDNKFFFEKTSSYASFGGFAEYYYYDTLTGECELFFTPSSLLKCRQLVFLDDKAYFDDKYDFSAEGYSSSVYSYDLISKTVNLEKESAESPIAYGGEILCYCKDGFYTLNNEFVFSPNDSDFVDVSEVVGGSILTFCNSVYDESGERAIGSASDTIRLKHLSAITYLHLSPKRFT